MPPTAAQTPTAQRAEGRARRRTEAAGDGEEEEEKEEERTFKRNVNIKEGVHSQIYPRTRAL